MKREYYYKPIKYKINLFGCHVCTSHYAGKDRPMITRSGKKYPLSRFMWEQKYGPISKGLFVCHKCDNPKCININHFWLGTQKENCEDCSNKGRSNKPKGENNHLHKLSIPNVKKIYFAIGVQKKIAKKYNISQQTVNSIKRNINWRWISQSW
jgi:hypothetical protein